MIQTSESALKRKNIFPTPCGYGTERSKPKKGKSESKGKKNTSFRRFLTEFHALSAWQAFQLHRLWGTEVPWNNIKPLSSLGALGHLLVGKGTSSAGKNCAPWRPLPKGSQGFVLRSPLCLQWHPMKYKEATQPYVFGTAQKHPQHGPAQPLSDSPKEPATLPLSKPMQ